MDKRQFVQQYVQRQRAYLPTYTVANPFDECRGTPSKPRRSDQFGFDTPVLRPRVPVSKTPRSQLAPRPRPSTSRAQSPALDEAPSEVCDPALSKRDKRKRATTPTDSDNERAARLADRRERKRKKRAIVYPPQQHNDEIVPTAAPRKGRANSQKAKKPAALALLYGLSATNVTKERLTLKPAPTLGVFSKGRASAKKKASATSKSVPRKEIFSESTFLNKSSERVDDHSKIDGDRLASSISSDPVPQATRVTNRTKDRGKCVQVTDLKTTQASTRRTAGSVIWDVELQSNLPSSMCDAASEPGASESAPAVLDLRGAKWSTSLHMAVERKRQARSLSVTQQSEFHVPQAKSNLGAAHVEDAPSIHPSHSASQVGRRVADVQPSELRQVGSRFFTERQPVSIQIQEPAVSCSQRSGSNDGFDVLDARVTDQGVHEAALHAERVVSPINTLISVAQPMAEFQTWYDVAPLEFPSDCSPYDDCCAGVAVPLEPVGDGGCFGSCGVERSTGELECVYEHPQRGGNHTDISSTHGGYGLLGPGDLEELLVSAGCDDLVGSGEESGEDGAQFLEGRALLRGEPAWRECVGLSGLAQAERDVARRLRDHWRPLRL